MNTWAYLPYFGDEFTPLDEVWHRTFHRLMFRGSRWPLRLVLPLLSGERGRTSAEFIRRIRKDLDALLEQDVRNVKAGYYPKSALRFDLPSYIYSMLASGPLDGVRVLQRAKQNNWKELPLHADKNAYPDYYLRTFHWQTDGWFSEESAKRYDFTVQFLFGGVADVMRRMALPPIAKTISTNNNVKILELACGTGSFIPQIQAAFPKARIVGVDLSPDYIQYARKHIKGTKVQFFHENAEHLSFENESFDAVICNNLFHELPPQVRRKIFSEVHRVLKNNAVFSITDSLQLGDNPNMNDSINSFSKGFHEPFHKQYIGDDLKGIFSECGFDVGGVQVNLFSKSIYGLKRQATE